MSDRRVSFSPPVPTAVDNNILTNGHTLTTPSTPTVTLLSHLRHRLGKSEARADLQSPSLLDGSSNSNSKVSPGLLQLRSTPGIGTP